MVTNKKNLVMHHGEDDEKILKDDVRSHNLVNQQ